MKARKKQLELLMTLVWVISKTNYGSFITVSNTQ